MDVMVLKMNYWRSTQIVEEMMKMMTMMIIIVHVIVIRIIEQEIFVDVLEEDRRNWKQYT